MESDASTTTKGISAGIFDDGEGSVSFGAPDVSITSIKTDRKGDID